jgi:hypothetical protein
MRSKSFQDRKYLRRVIGLLQEFWLMFRAHVSDQDLQAVDCDYEGNFLKLKFGTHEHPAHCMLLPVLRHFPGELLEGRSE